MSSITAEDLQSELRRFAETTIQRQLSDFANTLQEGLRKDFRSVLQEYHLSPTNHPHTALPGPSTDAWSLPNQPSVSDTTEVSIVDAQTQPAVERKDVSALSGRPARGRPSIESLSVTNPSRLEEHFPDNKPLEACAEELEMSRKRMTLMRSAIPATRAVAEELKDLHYFQDAKSLKPDQEGTPAESKYAQNMMLRAVREDVLTQHSHNPDAPELQSNIAKIVHSDFFEFFILFVICLNAAFIGIETNAVATDKSASESSVFKAFEITFMVIFAMELALRIFVFRSWFFKSKTPAGRKNPQLAWNVFDSVIVGIQVIEFIIQSIIDSGDDSVLSKATVLRLLRILRLGRLFRVAKLLRLFRTLRTIVHSISHSWSLFLWALISMQLINYLFAVYITEVVSAELAKETCPPDLKLYFGSVPDSMLSMMKSATGGIDWGDVYTPLMNFSSWIAAYPFFLCLMFHMIVVMNVFTGIFMDSVSKRAQQQKEIELVNSAYEIFKASDHNHTGQITKEDFEKTLSHPAVNQFFNAIDLDIQQAEVLFDLLDMSNDGFISCTEFLRGCLRLRGATKALDLLVLSREVTQLFDGIVKLNKENAETAYLQRQFLCDIAAETQLVVKALLPDQGECAQ